MSGKIQTRLAVIGAAVALVAVLVPSTFALGENGVYQDDILYLHMGGDGDFFASGEMMQAIGQSKCVVGLSGDDLASFDGTTGKGAGIKDHAIGVKSGNSQGVPCSRGSVSEVLHLSLGGDLSEKAINQAQMDIELKGNAVLEVVTYFNGEERETFTLSSGSATSGPSGNQATSDSESPDADCLSGVSDSGPDSGANDNCRWTIIPGDIFNGMTMEAISGEFSLEGGNDGTPPAEGSEEYGSDTLFFLEDLGSLITCGETETIADSVDISGEVTLHALDLVDGYTTDCGPGDAIEFLSQVQEGDGGLELYFVPTKSEECYVDEGGGEEYYELASESGNRGRYTTEIVVEDQEITVEGGQITSLVAKYDPDPCVDEGFYFNDTWDLLPCFGQPITDPSDPGYDDFWTQEDVGLLPDGESACWYFASAEPTSGEDNDGYEFEGTETWKIYFEVDPGFRF